ncbi:MAG: AAA family ATPase [Candidatus Aminicenantes bacterium]|nr:AAA family ATPase [Candidatus Aminicenantes bacterium]
MVTTVQNELIARSPLRILEKSISGGLGRGNIGVLASRKGVGKTACLVHIAVDKLFQGKPVIHVSYASLVDHIQNWYEDVFKEIARLPRMKAAVEIHDEVIGRRVIMNFKQDGARTEQVLRSIEAMIVHGQFPAETVIVDGYDFAPGGPEDLAKFKDFAGRLGLEVWFSGSLRGEEPLFDEQGVPRELRAHLDGIDVLISLQHHGDHVHFNLVKDHGRLAPKDLRLRLDPTTLLIAREK